MKKGLLIGLLFCFSAAMMAQSEEAVQPQTADSLKGVHPYKLEQNEKGVKPEIAHWSIIPHFGFSAFDGDFTSEMKHTVAIPSVGLGVEYNFTPIWNIGIEYMYDMYNVTGAKNAADTLLTGHMHKAGAYLSMDLINLLFPRAHKKIVSILPYVGGGMAFYKRAKYYMDDMYYDAQKGQIINPTHDRGNTTGYINADGELGPDRDKKYQMLGYLQAGVNLEFNLNRTLALGVRANYSYFTRDYMDGRGYHKQSSSSYASKNNDGIFDVTLNLRIKLEAVKKSHPRNMPSYAEFDKLVAAGEEAQPATNAIAMAPAPDTVIIRHDSVIIREIIREKKQPRIYNVYFDNDKDELRQDAQSTINEAAMAMEEDPTLYAVVIGYCDNTGSKAHNYDLGDRRSKNVNNQLAEEYGIPADHIYNAGVGKIAARKSDKSFGPNRRVSIHLVDKETFELMKLELDDKNSNRNTDDSKPVVFNKENTIRTPRLEALIGEDVETVSLAESARKIEDLTAQYKNRTSDTVTVEKGITLSKLARKYYNNTQCWVYIYMANNDKLATPNNLQEGTQLIIPELTQEELKITMNECLRLYGLTARKNRNKTY